jgi:hypothetical protein
LAFTLYADRNFNLKQKNKHGEGGTRVTQHYDPGGSHRRPVSVRGRPGPIGEYGLILGLIAVVALAALTLFGTAIVGKFDLINVALG